MRRAISMFTAFVLLNSLAGAVAAQDACERASIDALGHDNTHVRGLNNWGTVVGELIGSTDRVPFVWRAGTTEVLDLGDGSAGGATGINDLGRIVGWTTVGGRDVPVTWTHGRLARLQFAGEGDAMAVGVNNLGQIVGYARRPNRCLLWPSAASAPVQFGGGEGEDCTPWAINDAGMIVGLRFEQDELQPFLWHRGHFTEIPAPPPPPDEQTLFNPTPFDLNNFAVVLGRAVGESRVYGFTWTPIGGSRLLPYPLRPQAVNDWGVIAITSQGGRPRGDAPAVR